ncbi:MAG: S46 family peptidase [Luteibaculaceae bacterium]
MRNVLHLALFLILTPIISWGKEGMWIPSLVGLYNLTDMQAMGMKLSAEDIYSLEDGSLKDAIVHFGGGCTAEVISENGLILTNHHCGYRQIQFHSSLENDYLKNGFWANSLSEELPNPGLTATFIVSITDVTETILLGAKGLSELERANLVAKRIDSLEKAMVTGTHYKAKIRPFYYGNQYFSFVTEVFNDVRLVGAPPSNIGKFGGDTDNWMWPRHTGDFAIFRIYANEQNMPAPFSDSNRPFKPRRSLEIDIAPRVEEQFTMVYGFPGLTETYLSAESAEFVINEITPFRLKMREASLSVIDAAMRASDLTRIQYASKQSSISNAYKKWIGQNQGLLELDAINLKRAFEEEFNTRLSNSPTLQAEHKNVMQELSAAQKELEPYQFARNCLIEYFYYGPEFLGFANSIRKLANTEYTAALTQKEKDKIIDEINLYFKNYDASVDRAIFLRQTPIYLQYHDPKLLAPEFNTLLNRTKQDVNAMADLLFSTKGVLNNQKFLLDYVNNPTKGKAKKLASDPMFVLGTNIIDTYLNTVNEGYRTRNTVFESAMRKYIAAQMDLFENDKTFWPDANSSLRITYGMVEGSAPRDGMKFKHFTTANGILQKYLTGNPDYEVNERLKGLIEAKDFGPYAQDGELYVCFTGSNHTTGGNSGSPVLNAHGQLIGINFDRSWESTMSDIKFNPDRCRNISVDSRYILFIIDKYAKCSHIMNELKIVNSANL